MSKQMRSLPTFHWFEVLTAPFCCCLKFETDLMLYVSPLLNFVPFELLVQKIGDKGVRAVARACPRLQTFNLTR
jgi:hypothetical protein